MNATTLAALVFAALILFWAEPTLAMMSPMTHWIPRYTALSLAAGALGVILMVSTDAIPPAVPIAFLICGLCLLVAWLIRTRTFHHHHRNGDHHAQG